MIIIGLRLFWLTSIEHEQWVDAANNNMEKTIRTDAPRGEIYDRNGVLLAGNHSGYAVDFSRNMMSNKQANDSAALLLDIFKRHGEKLIDEFPIKVNKKGEYYYSFDREIEKWLKTNKMKAGTSARKAFNKLREHYEISPELSDVEAQQKMLEIGVSPPISVKKMMFTEYINKQTFLEQFKIEMKNDGPPAEDAFREIIKFYELDKQFPDLSDKEYRKILILRSALTSQGYWRWMPVKVASGVSEECVLEIKERSHDLGGVEIVSESVRYYPQKERASHVVGYLGKIADEGYASDNEYKLSDLIGLSGIEKSQEDILRGRDGMKNVLVNSSGEVIRNLGDEKTAQKGKDIMLTIDVRLQKIAEESLKKALSGIRVKGSFDSSFGRYAFSDASPNAQVGAAVLVDIKTGEPLAIASEPGFDPNVFAEGISSEDWNALQGDNPRDPLAPRPLYNVAARTAVQPGSTFKPMTGMVAQQMGLDPYRYLYDVHAVEIGDREYTCMGHHGSVNLFSALQVSCNVFFYDAATGRDWSHRIGNSAADLGYAKKINPDVITKYAKQFGLGVETGAEIDETITDPPTAELKMKNMQSLLRQKLFGEAEYIFTEKILNDYNKLEDNINNIVSWAEENPPIEELKNRLMKLGVKKSEAFSTAQTIKYSYFNFASWTTGDEFNIAIGQGENAYTPLQMARYIATMGNGGKLNSFSLIKAVEGEGEVERPKAKKSKIKSEYISNVLVGMRRVVTGGTLSRGMSGLPFTVAGKTGTAQRSGRINPPDEVEYIKSHLSQINPNLSWKKVKKEMKRIMKKYPKIYSNEDIAVRKAVLNLSGRKFNSERLDYWKPKYNDFAWVMALAPAEKPEVAAVCLIVQGGPSSNAVPVARELLGQYFKIKAGDKKKKDKIDYNTFFNLDKKERLMGKKDSDKNTIGAILSDGALYYDEIELDDGNGG